jgi:hypothetical protein
MKPMILSMRIKSVDDVINLSSKNIDYILSVKVNELESKFAYNRASRVLAIQDIDSGDIIDITYHSSIEERNNKLNTLLSNEM